jgi:transcriptional regulator with XRE-family HTH domain
MAEDRPDFNHIKEWLLPKLDERGMSVEQFANGCGITRGMLYFYLADKHRPSEQVMVKMCQILGVPLEEGLNQYIPRKSGRPAGSRK